MHPPLEDGHWTGTVTMCFNIYLYSIHLHGADEETKAIEQVANTKQSITYQWCHEYQHELASKQAVPKTMPLREIARWRKWICEWKTSSKKIRVTDNVKYLQISMKIRKCFAAIEFLQWTLRRSWMCILATQCFKYSMLFLIFFCQFSFQKWSWFHFYQFALRNSVEDCSKYNSTTTGS